MRTSVALKPNFVSLISSRMWKIPRTVRNSKNKKYDSREACRMESAHEKSEEAVNEWAITVFKDKLSEQLSQPIQHLKESSDGANFRNVDRREANHVFLWAAFQGELDLMRYCIEKGADVSFTDESDNFNALHLASMAGSVECCKWLLEEGCPIIQTIDEMTPMHYATLGNSKEVVEYLIICGCGVPSTAMNSAVYANAVDCVKFLLSLKADVNAYYDGMTPLHVAADLQHIECMEELLNDPRIGINLKTQAKKYTALHYAAENGYVGCIELLLEKRAKINEVNHKLQTPLHLACKMECLDTIEVLLKNHARVDEKDIDHKTPLHAAIAKSPYSLAKIQLLVRWKANVNVSDRYGYTPLHLAAINESEECTTFLILHGGNVAAETKSGTTALNMINRKTPNSIPAIWKRLTKSLAYNTEQSLKFSFRELITNSSIGEIGFMYVLQKEDHKDILKHPLCRAFLYLKWEKIKPIYIIRVFTVILTTCFLSYLVLCDVIEQKCCPFENQTLHHNCANDTSSENYTDAPSILWYFAVVLAILNVLRNLSFKNAYPSFRRYLSNNLNLFELVIMILVLILFATNSNNSQSITCSWRNLIGTCVILLTWTDLTLVIGQLPYFGAYITMFSKVFKELLKLLTVYFCLLMGFTLTFRAIYHDIRDKGRRFDDLTTGFAQTLSMMTGELNADNIIQSVKDSDNTIHKYGATVFLIFFVVVVNMSLMNLLIGIAASDVEGLQKTADLSKLVHQTKLIYYLEFAFFRGYVPKKLTQMFKKCLFVSPDFYRVVMYVRPLNPLENRLPQDIMKEALQLALNKNKPDQEGDDEVICRLEKLEDEIEKIRHLLLNLTNTLTQKLPICRNSIDTR